MPYGCMIPVAVGKRISWKKGLLIGMATSAVIEVLQFGACVIAHFLNGLTHINAPFCFCET